MDTVKVKRMNFLRQKKSSVTYGIMVKALVAWCVFLVLLFGVQLYREMSYSHKAKTSREEAARLDGEKGVQLEQIKKFSKKKLGISAKEGLSTILARRPRWSVVLGALTKNLPSQVSLDSVVVLEEVGGEYKIDIEGNAKAQNGITNFIIGLESSGMFRGTSLVNSKLTGEEEGDISFTLETRPISLGF